MTREDIAKLSDDDLRVKVAESIGWTDILTIPTEACGNQYCGRNPKYINGQIPDYSSDLNAMHEAENDPKLSRERDIWSKNLREILSREVGIPCEIHYTETGPGDTDDLVYDLLRMTARQRAEAFLAVMQEPEVEKSKTT
jgi:hypothetical protein